MKSVLLICGHKNIANITQEGLRSWRSASTLAKSTGASGEVGWVWDKLMPLLRDKLIALNYQVFITDAIYHKDTYSRDYDLAVALHYNGALGDNPPSTCIISKPRENIDPPFINQSASDLSDSFISKWIKIYPEKTGITLRQDLVTAGMTDYYAWDYVGMDTPSVILEHGNWVNTSDYKKMFEQTNMIAEADVEAINSFLNPVIITPPTECEKALSDCQFELRTTRDNLITYGNLISQAKAILYGKGFIWAKLRKLKALLPQG